MSEKGKAVTRGKSSRTAGIVVGLALVAVSVSWFTTREGHQTSVREAPVANRAATVGDGAVAGARGVGYRLGVTHRRVERRPRDARAIPLGLPGDTMESMKARLEPLLPDDRDALVVLRGASLPCARFSDWTATPNVPVSASAAYIKSYLQRFCGATDARSDVDRYNRLLSRPGSPEAVARLEAESMRTNSTAGAVEVAVESNKPWLLERAASSIQYFVDEPWNAGVALTSGTPLQPRLRELQAVAIRSVSCDYSDQCGPDGIVTMGWCVNAQACAPDADMDVVWSKMYTPDEMEVIAGIRDQLLKARGNRRMSR
jgi:hypothetical protein